MSRPQSGIINRPPQHLILAALDFVERTRAGARTALAGLENVVERELRSDLDAPNPAANKDVPSEETGELGFEQNYDRGHLTITLGLASTAFDVLEVTGEDRPSDLRPLPWAEIGGSQPARPSGDLILQVCGDDLHVCEHVIRRIEEELAGSLRVLWTQLGVQRYVTRSGRTSREEGRALIGFIDGSTNLNPRNVADDRKLVLVDPSPEAIATYPQNPPSEPGPTGPYDGLPTGPRFPANLAPVPTREPEWTRNGTYMVVHISMFETTPWDDLSQNQQEGSVGRFKVSGASLDLTDEPHQLQVEPAFVANQANTVVPLASHVRKANPRRSPEDALRRLHRRGYPIIESADGGVHRGLAFIAFARTTSTQFEFIMRGWLRNPDFPEPGTGNDLLLATLPEAVLCGGYYFVPAIRKAPWTLAMPQLP
jgi:deferrochelatase/peroxidase EfeB